MDSFFKPTRFYLIAVLFVTSVNVMKWGSSQSFITMSADNSDSNVVTQSDMSDIQAKEVPRTDHITETNANRETKKRAEVLVGHAHSSVELDEWESINTPIKKQTNTADIPGVSKGDGPMKKVQTVTDSVAKKIGSDETAKVNPTPNKTQVGTANLAEKSAGDGASKKSQSDDVANKPKGVANTPSVGWGSMKKWEELWRESFGIQSNASETLSSQEIQTRMLLFNESHTLESAKERGTLAKLFETFPLPKRQKHDDAVSLYNEDAYRRLVAKLLLAQSGQRQFKIVASGGSTTAGGGKPTVPGDYRYFGRFTDYLKNLLSINHTGIECIDQGHGTRNSIHTAVLYDQFIPLDADLLIWEFSINDSADPDLRNEVKIQHTAKHSFLALMNQIKNMEQPPFVMLVYYWDAPYHRSRNTSEVVGNSFRANGDIARHFDFVVGHVNMISYIEELQFKGCRGRDGCPFLSDKHHASYLGHIATAYLLLNLLNPDTLVDSSESDRTLSGDKDYVWTCGVETEAKKVLKSVITNSSTGWKSAAGSWTLELPAYNQSSPRSLFPPHPFAKIDYISRGAIHRQDRQRSTPIGYCNKEDTFSLISRSKPLQNVRVMLLVFEYNWPLMKTDDINVHINGANETIRGELVPMFVYKMKEKILRNWPCDFACTCAWGTNVDLYWYIFESIEPSVHSVRLCSASFKMKPPKLQALAVW